MVLLAAAVCTKVGKPLLSRQFVEMSRARIEGLLAAFPKLMITEKSHGTTQKQHTFVETESVRYVYQPLDQVYMLLITTKASNILEDLETLRLFSRVIPEYCRNIEEKEIIENAFHLIFAFDEIVALGYRESVNLAQIRTFTDMESHDEKVYLEIKKSQERDARDKAKEKARELTQARKEAIKRGHVGRGPGSAGGGYSGIGSGGMKSDIPGIIDNIHDSKPTYIPPSRPSIPGGGGGGMKLGGKKKDIDSFVDQLKSEGQEVVGGLGGRGSLKTGGTTTNVAPISNIKAEKIHIRTEEKMSLTMTRDGGIETLETHGLMALRITDANVQKIGIKIDNNDKHGAQPQTHPNLDKRIFANDSVLTLKNIQKPFPLNTEVGVLKWRFQSNDESKVPLSINCWPSETSKGCDVNIEFTLEQEDLELQDVVITIPLPSGSTPKVDECEGEYRHDRPKNILEWKLPLIDVNNKNGTLEFSTTTGQADHFFPVKIEFVSSTLFCDIRPSEVSMIESGDAVKFSCETSFYADKYEIV